MFDNITKENYLLYAIKAYDKPNMLMSEFHDDIKKIYYLKRLFKKYKNTGECKEILVINHIIILYNVFGVEAANRLLFYKINSEYYYILKTYLIFLNCMPEKILGINGNDIISSEIQLDNNLIVLLREILNRK